MSLSSRLRPNSNSGTEDRRGSQISPPNYRPQGLNSKPFTFGLHVQDTTSTGTSSGDESEDESTCPFLNKDHLPQLRVVREQLRCFFKSRNRVEMFKKRPWAFLIQFLKLVLITCMLVTLKNNNYSIRIAVEEIKDALSHLLIRDFDTDTPNRRLYTFKDLNESAIYAAEQYMCLSDTAISLMGYPNGLRPDKPPPVQININHLAAVNISNDWVIEELNGSVLNYTHFMECTRCNNSCVGENIATLDAWLQSLGTGTLRYTMLFSLQALLIGYLSAPHCVHLIYELYFENTLETGMETGILLHYDFNECQMVLKDDPAKKLMYYVHMGVDVGVVLVCLISIIVTLKKMDRGYKLYVKTRDFIKRSYYRSLNRREKNLFISYWHLCIILADVMLIGAGILKLLIDLEQEYHFDSCTLLLGGGVWLTYLGLLRYLVFDKHYSMLLNTMVVALPHLARFLICVIIISLSFILCGWLILSPYCTKFATFFVTMETLFSLLNGDDMYATFSLVKTSSSLTQRIIGVFSRIYLYTYVCFFIYVVLSLCISIIEDAYIVVSNYRSDFCPWIQDDTVLPEFATCWEVNLNRQRSKSKSSMKSAPRSAQGTLNRI